MPFFGGGGASVDLASPPAIGNTTPNTGAFTTLSANNGTITTSSPAFTLEQTWNAAGVAFTALRVNATDTASASGSLLMDLRVGGASRFSVTKQGSFTASDNSRIAKNSGVPQFFVGGSDSNGCIVIGTSLSSTSGGAIIASDFFGINGIIGFRSGLLDINSSGSLDVVIRRDAADILAQRRTTNAQTFRLYRTFTDASNYERLGFIATRTTRFAIAAENAGTGAARSLEISFYTSASDPASTDITDGCFSVWKNSGTGTIKMWANDGGTMKSVALA